MPNAVRRHAGFVVLVLTTCIAHRLLGSVVTRLATLAPSAYEGPVFVDDLLRRLVHLVGRVPWWLAVAGVGILALAAHFARRALIDWSRSRVLALVAPWSVLQDGSALRVLVVAIAGLLTWVLALYPRNVYLNQLHLLERVLLLLFWLALIWRPVFVFGFAIVAATIAGQLLSPVGLVSMTEINVVMQIPILFGAYWLVRTLVLRNQGDAFVFVLCCLMAATYWTSGIGKLRVDWLSYRHIDLLLPAAHANGWLTGVSTRSIEQTAQFIDRFSLPLMLGTLLIECGAIALLWKRWSLVAFLSAAIVFHLVAFALTGIFFWKWIAVEMVLLMFILRRTRVSTDTLFTPVRFALSVLVIAGSPLWTHSENLTWFDTPLTYSLRLEGIDQRGNMHSLPAGAFRPYSDGFVIGNFAAISPYVRLTGAMGATGNRDLAEALVAARSPADVFALEAKLGSVRTNPQQLLWFDNFIARASANLRCARLRRPRLLEFVSPPRHLFTTPLDAELPCDVTITRVRVTEVTSFYDGATLQVIRTRMLRDIVVEPR